jgi:transposase
VIESLRKRSRLRHKPAVNQLKMDLRQSIITLSGEGWSQRRIARELGIDRETVAKYRREARTEAQSKPAIVPPGSPAAEPLPTSEGTEPKPALVPAGSPDSSASKPALVPPGSSPGRTSQCEPFREAITLAWEAGLSAQRIYQDLVTDQQFTGNYDAVKRFVRRLGQARPLPFRRMETEPGQEAQVDYGQGAWVVEEGRRRRPHVLRVVLSCSRKGYTEVFWQQTTENFIRGLENAFRHFGGVPRTLVIDNMRAAVSKADWFDPELNPKVLSFCEHYRTVILPTRPAMPRHKGKVEAGVKYVQNNGLAGRHYESLSAQNLFLTHWEETVADTRIHGTTRQQVRAVFLSVEKPQLLPLPSSLFPVFSEAPRKVHRDGYVEVAKAYYSVPPEYVRRQVWARWDAKLVHVYNERRQVIAVHVRQEAGRFCTDPAHIHEHKRCVIERGADWLLDRCRLLGNGAGAWAENLYQNRGPQSLRVLQGLLALAEKHPVAQLNQACQLALTHGSWHLSDLKALLAQPTAQEQFDFIQAHPLIRDLHAYHNVVPVCFHPTETQTLIPEALAYEQSPS